ncbi:hypothetical protein ACT1U9_28350 [Streptomyces sp. BR1]|uniref:hypothetical protein n=1 Tax=Streptomyces sp. BR1 TaxID=1592323 RepID=UPI00402B91E4
MRWRPLHCTGDPVQYGNDVLLGAFRTAGGAPGPITRAAAMMNTAIYDAESSYQLRRHTMASDPYLKAINYGFGFEGAAAWFWANDANGTFKPPGQPLDTTARVAKDRNLTLYQNARLFTLVSVAMADAVAGS